MTFHDEEELYQHFLKSQKELLQELGMRDPEYYHHYQIWEKEKPQYKERTNNLGQRLYIIGEIHGMSQPVEVIHRQLVPPLQKYPSEWLFLVENAGERFFRAEEEPNHFYYQELAALLGIPYEDPLEDILDRATQSFIQDATGYTTGTIDKYFIEEAAAYFINIASIEAREKLNQEHLCELLARTFERKKKIVWPAEYILRQFQQGPLHLFKREKIDAAWNNYSKLRFQRLCQQYSDRHHLLIVVGAAHMRVFE